MVNTMLKKAASLTLAIGSTILLAPFVKAEPSQEIVDKCMKASDFEGCIRVFSGKKPEEKKMTIDIDKVRTSGNTCPSGFAYLGAGQCQDWDCAGQVNDSRLAGKGWTCKGGFLGRGGMRFTGQIVQATTAEYCPLEEPEIGNYNSCWNGVTEDEIKRGIIMYRIPPQTKVDDGTWGSCNSKKQIVVDKVYPNTPASEAGIKPGEIAISIDGESICTNFFNMSHNDGQVRIWTIKGLDGRTREVAVVYRSVTIPEQVLKLNTKTNQPVLD